MLPRSGRTRGGKSATYDYSSDGSGNLLEVTDLSGTVIKYEYAHRDGGFYNALVYPSLGTNANYYKVFNQPAKKTVDPGDNINHLNLVTTYRYEAKFNKMVEMKDAEGMVTEYLLDRSGNREEVVEDRGGSGHFNRTTKYAYDENGFILQITDPDGRVTTRTKDKFGNLKTTTVRGYDGELELTTATEMDVMGRTMVTRDPKGNETTFTYDKLDRVMEVVRPKVAAPAGPGTLTASSTFTFYDPNGNVTRVEDDNGVTTIFEYDLLNRRTSSRIRMKNRGTNDESDIVTSTKYNGIGLVEEETDPKRNVTTYEYDELLRLQTKTYPTVTTHPNSTTRYVERYQYEKNFGSGAFSLSGWKPNRVINPRGFATDTIYDKAYRPIRVVSRTESGSAGSYDDEPGDGEPVVETTYNKVHQKVRERVWTEDFDDNLVYQTTFYDYDSLHRLNRTTFDFDGSGSRSDEDFVTEYRYDLAGNRISETDPEGTTTTYKYDGASRLFFTAGPSESHFDPVSRKTVFKAPTNTITYDLNSNKEVVTDANGNQTKHFYDSRNRLIKTVQDMDGDGAFGGSSDDIVTETHYDLTENVIRVVDGRGNETNTEYDNAYRVIEIRGPPVPNAEQGGSLEEPVTQTDYDENSNVLEVIDPRGVIIRNEYDELNRLRTSTAAFGTADAVTTESQYDNHSNVIALILKNQVDGEDREQKTTYAFDHLDRQTLEILPEIGDGEVRQTSTTYYRNSTVRSVKDAKGQVVENEYDFYNRKTECRYLRDDGTVEETRTFAYDDVGNIKQLADLNGTTIYSYDDLYRVTAETRLTDGQAGYTVKSFYDPNGNRTKCIYPTTDRTLISTYDRLDRLFRIDDADKVSLYAYDKNSNRLLCELPNGLITSNSYDALNRVEHMANRVGEENVYAVDYTYDLVGNRRTIREDIAEQGVRDLTYDYDSQYRLVSEAWDDVSYAYTYDPAGNRLELVHREGATARTTKYTYDDLNRLVTADKDGEVTSYEYDLNGNRIEKRVGGEKSTYAFDVIDRLVGVERGGDTVFEASYDYRTRRLTKTENGATTYFRYDSGNSYQEITNGTVRVEFIRGSGMGGGIGSILYFDRGGEEEYFSYNAVGHTVALTDEAGGVEKTDLYEAFGGGVSSTGESKNNRLANTKERDASIGLDNHGFRYYDAEIGRYVTRDPIGYEDGFNVYVYVGGNPVNGVDPLGLSDEESQDVLSRIFRFFRSYAAEDLAAVGAISEEDLKNFESQQETAAEASKRGSGVVIFFAELLNPPAGIVNDYERGSEYGGVLGGLNEVASNLAFGYSVSKSIGIAKGWFDDGLAAARRNWPSVSKSISDFGRRSRENLEAIVNKYKGKSVSKGRVPTVATSGDELAAWFRSRAVKLRAREKKLLQQMDSYGSYVQLGRKEVSMGSLVRMSKETGDEFALLTRGNQRIVIRGNPSSVPIQVGDKNAYTLGKEGWRYSGHIHPTRRATMTGQGDPAVLDSIVFRAESRRA